ncbi:MAG: beta-ketoacyl-[acyl-carrier-protein] synthase family protein [bacterium]
MPSRIVVTGMGMITAIGKNVASILQTVHQNEFVAGEIKVTHEQLIELAGANPAEPWTRTALLALIAAKEAYQDAGLHPGEELRTALISATTVGGMDRSELMYKDFLSRDEYNPYIDTHHAGNSTEQVASQLKINGFISTVSTACSSSLNSIMFGARLIASGLADRVITGGTDALSKFTLNGFNSLMILDRKHCRPFDSTREGLNLGEGAAYLVLEREEIALNMNKPIYATLSGFANANDAFHQTASSEEGIGPYLSMQRALEIAGLSPGDIDYINVHGTGTGNNDLTEGRALLKLFGEGVPDFSSTKAFTGHTLGAAGAVEAIFSIIALKNNLLLPNINFSEVIPELNLKPVTKTRQKKLNHVLTNSFGFGGNDSSLVFSKYGSENKNLATHSGSKESPAKYEGSARLNNPVFINGTGCIAPQETLDESVFLENPLSCNEKYLQVVKPEYRKYIDPKALRRMSKIVRMGMVASQTALKDSGTDHPDAIITGTGMGCQADTEKFLNAMIDDRENLLNPTAFIQSTHNTMGAQIALMSGNNNYNLAFVHRTFSFESALLDSLIRFRENKAQNILVGGIDEITEESWKIKTHINYFSREEVNNLELTEKKTIGALAGESASFFVLSKYHSENTYARLLGVETFFKPKSREETIGRVRQKIEANGLRPQDMDLVLMGYNGDKAFDKIYDDVGDALFKHADIGFFKHLCGEHDTASAFATWLAARILKEKKMPEILIRKRRRKDLPRNILIYNQFRNINHSLILLQNI